MGRIGIQVSTQTISFNSDVPRAPVLGTFENGVFDKVADAV
jgi:hypothetical protein